MLKFTALLLACVQGTVMRTYSLKSSILEERNQKLSQSLATAFNMAPPKLMPQNPKASNGECPVGPNIKKLTLVETGGAFMDGCYMNTTRR